MMGVIILNWSMTFTRYMLNCFQFPLAFSADIVSNIWIFYNIPLIIICIYDLILDGYHKSISFWEESASTKLVRSMLFYRHLALNGNLGVFGEGFCSSTVLLFLVSF
jgi:hypothetical protein